MTTNVRDSLAHVMAVDSRWSIDLQPYGITKLLYLDESNYQKLIVMGSGLFMFAGSSKLIDSWKFAIGLANHFPNAVNWSDMPTTGLAVCAVERQSGRVRFDMNHTINELNASFAGSGAIHAASCWIQNQDAIRAVDTAKNHDIFTGGQVRYYRLTNGENNIGEDGPLSGLNKMLAEKGFVMDTKTKFTPAKTIQEAVQNDAVLKSVVDEVAKGNISATAPHEHMNKVWTEEEKRRLFGAMEYFYPKS